MSELENIITKGSETLHIPTDKEKSELLIPVNENWSQVIKQGVENSAFKAWSDGESSELPVSYDERCPVVPGQYTLCHRLPNNIFKVFGHNVVCMIRDKGNGTGVMLLPTDNPNVFTEYGAPLTMIAIDPLTQFHNSAPPFLINRIYWGYQQNNFYYVFVPGFSSTKNTITRNFEDSSYIYTLEIDHDNSGKVLDFRVTAEEQVVSCTGSATEDYYFYGYEPDDTQSDYFDDTIGSLLLDENGEYYIKVRATTWDSTTGSIDPNWVGHEAWAGKWLLEAYTNYDSDNKIYSDLIFSHDQCVFGISNDYSNYIKVYQPRTYTPNKDKYYSNYDLYCEPTNAAYVRVCEPNHNRGSWYPGTVWDIGAPRWYLSGNMYAYYDKINDIGNYYFSTDPSNPAYGYLFWYAESKERGINDTAAEFQLVIIDWHLATQNAQMFGISYVYAYALSSIFYDQSQYCNGGGGILTSRYATNWKIWDTNAQSYVNAPSGTIIGNKDEALAAVDKWRSYRFAKSYDSDYIVLL